MVVVLPTRLEELLKVVSLDIGEVMPARLFVGRGPLEVSESFVTVLFHDYAMVMKESQDDLSSSIVQHILLLQYLINCLSVFDLPYLVVPDVASMSIDLLQYLLCKCKVVRH